MANSRIGAYGFVFRGLEEARDWLVKAPEDWPEVSVIQQPGPGVSKTRLGEAEAEVALVGGRGLYVRRDPPEVRFIGSTTLSDVELIHPFLAPAAAVLANWHGWISLHAGAFVVGDRAWVVTAERNGGKSTVLAALAESGVSVLADDLVVLKDGMALAGPRSVDLREESGLAELDDLGTVGQRRRWRMALSPVPPATKVAGVIKLEWSRVARARQVGGEGRAAVIKSAVSGPSDRHRLLRVLALPVFEVRRPRGPLRETLQLVEEVVANFPDAPQPPL